MDSLTQLDAESTIAPDEMPSASASPSPHAGDNGTSLSVSPTARKGRSLPVERRLLQRLLERLGRPPIEVVLWDGEEVRVGDLAPTHRLHVANRRALWRLGLHPMMHFGAGYADGSIRVEGDFAQLLRHVVQPSHGPAGSVHRPRSGFLRTSSRPVGLAAARKNIHHHYDIGNEFYKLWLDEQMLYTCAYYRDPRMSLEAAQTAKMDHIGRKLQLQPGETVIEAGCGWGGFALHMARKYGVTVRAYNISHEQVAYARDSARRENLDGKVEFIEDDWRNITGECDAFVSVGMLEHAGIGNYRQLGDVIDGCLHARGRGLIHTIGRNFPQPLNPWVERHIFPGAAPPALGEMMDIFEQRNFSVLDVENLRLHYARTCRHWLQRFEVHASEVRDMFDDRFVRMWRMYLAASMVAFENGTLQLFQVLFAPGRNNRIPWTRAYQYAAGEIPERGAEWRSLCEDETP